jgi:D-glycero-D-manno-heptose 1,7-bisphosphate phosphatase
MTASQEVRAVFFDRDGVLNRLVWRDGAAVSPRSRHDFAFQDDAASAVEAMRSLGFLIFVVTNQPDIARGHLPQEELDEMSAELTRALKPDAIAVCPHDDQDRCRCRKPEPGLILDLAREWNVSLPSSYVVGDSWRDIRAGRQAGCHTIFVNRGKSDPGSDLQAEACVPDLDAAVRYIRSREH